MGTITSLDSFRAERVAPQPAQSKLRQINRTPELALIMAIFEELPREDRGRALAKVVHMAERCPDCEASQDAAYIAALLALKPEGR